MRKKSAPSDKKSGSAYSFKKKDIYKAHNDNNPKPPRKSRDDEQVNHRTAGSTRPTRGTGKPFARDTEGGERPKRSFDKPFGDKEQKPFSDRPKRSFDKDSDSSFRKPKRDNDRAPREEGSRPFQDRRKTGEGKPFADRPKRSFDKPDRDGGDSRPFRDRPKPGGDRDGKPFSDRPKRSFDKSGGDSRPFSDRPERSFDKSDRDGGDRKPFSDRPKRSFDKPDRDGADRPKRNYDKSARDGGDSKPFSDRPKRSFDKPARDGGDSRPFRDRPKRDFDKPAYNNDAEGGSTERKPRKDAAGGDTRPFRDRPKRDGDKPFKDKGKSSFTKKPFGAEQQHTEEDAAAIKKSTRKPKHEDDDDDEYEPENNKKTFTRPEADELMPLNKYIAHSGECSRRDAAEMVRQGKVKVNDELILDPGHKVVYGDKVTLSGKKLTPQKGFVYILLNKPKGFITTNDDPQGRRTVMDLVGNSGVDRLFPIGRLDRATTGLILITNDGDLTQRLSHPTYNIKKVYHVTLDKPLTKADFDTIMVGVELEDGKAIVDEMAYLEKKTDLGLEIHSGKNRIVRRIFESLGYVVEKLDRVMYAGLTKKNLPRSKWRYLDEREIVLLKHFKN